METCRFTEGVCAHLNRKRKLTHTQTHTVKYMKARTRPLATPLSHRATGRLCSIPLKVLWAVISKTIPWMAALIENNEGHIEHMVAVVSPFPPSSLLFSLPLSLCMSLSPQLPQTKGSGKLCLSQAKICVARAKRKDIVKVVLFFPI